MVLTVIFSAITSSLIVNADELDGYTKVDWSWNRDMETTDANSVIVGGNIPFWRYVNKTSPANNNAIWKSIYGDELSDDDVTKIWLGDIDKRYVVASVDVANIPDENIRQYIYDHIDEDLPDLKFKFDIDADVEGNSNLDKAKTLFDGDIGYRVYRDGDTCKIEMKFSPKFHLIDNYDPRDVDTLLPNMPRKKLPKARYPYSSVIFSMWGYNGGSNEHYGALEVVEGDDPKYIYGQSFGYGDILEKGKIPNNMVYPNFEAGEINQEGTWAGTVESDTLDSNLIRIGQQFKKRDDSWYYSYGGAVGYNFKFPFKVSLAVDNSMKITKRIINYVTGEVILENTDSFAYGSNSVGKMYVLADKSGYAYVDNDMNFDVGYAYNHFDVKRADNNEILGVDSCIIANVAFDPNIKHKILDVYVTPLPVESKLIVRYVDIDTGEDIKTEEVKGKVLTTPDDEDIIKYTIDPPKPQVIVKKYVVEDLTGRIEEEKENPDPDVSVRVSGTKPILVLIISCTKDNGGGGDDISPTPTPTPKPNDDNNGDDEPATTPIDPPMCDSEENTIQWEEREKHSYTGSDNKKHTCYHYYVYEAKLKVDSVDVSPTTLKSGYGVTTDISTSVSYRQVAKYKEGNCDHRLSTSRTPTSKPKPPTTVAVRMGWTTHTFDGDFIQDSTVLLDKVSGNSTTAKFSAPTNSAVGQKMIYTDIYLSGTGSEPRRHVIAFDIYGGGVDGTQWCTTVTKELVINGDMYEDAGTTSTY